MRHILAAVFSLISLPAYALSVPSHGSIGDIGFVPLAVMDAAVGVVPRNITRSQHFSAQQFSLGIGPFPPGTLRVGVTLLPQVILTATILAEPPLGEPPFPTFRDVIAGSFSGTFQFFNNGSIVEPPGPTSFRLDNVFGFCRSGECQIEGTGFTGLGGVLDTTEPLDLAIQFSDHFGTMQYQQEQLQPSFVQISAQFDIQSFGSWSFMPAPKPVSEVPAPPTVYLLISALSAITLLLVRARSRNTGPAIA